MDQPSECSWNASYRPGNAATAVNQDDLPVGNVDWCDAFAFCKWAGKRLCGKVGGGSADYTNFASKDNEHYVACSNDGMRKYPYGDNYDPSACNGMQPQQMGHAVPVGSLKSCEGGVPGLFDMSGNVEEWQDACDGNSGATDNCRDGTGGFDYGAPPDGTRCDAADSDARNAQFAGVGIRCCATPPG
jgi:formylglycine-generating enzyme required for sulfatase activity